MGGRVVGRRMRNKCDIYYEQYAFFEMERESILERKWERGILILFIICGGLRIVNYYCALWNRYELQIS
jgi:hypothetical protein